MKKFNTPDTLFQRTIALCLVALFALLAACSSVRFTYNQGDTLLYWWLDSYADLEGQQADIAKRDIDKLFQWHRQTQLRDYAALLGTMQRELAGNPTQADLINIYREIRVRGERLATRAVPELTTLALSIKPDQIADIERKFNTKNTEYREKFIEGSVEKRQRARFKKAMDQLELWFGRFSNEQEDALTLVRDLAARGQRFDVIFLDPPYQLGLLTQILPLCRALLKEDGMVYAETGEALPLEGEVPDWLGGWEAIREDKAGMVYYYLLKPQASAA